MSRRARIESSNILEGPRKRLRGNNDPSSEDAPSPSAAPFSSAAPPSTASMGVIERRIHSLSSDQVTQHGQKLMHTIMEAIDPSDGDPLHEFFLELPNAQEYPDYYDIIKRPMALEQIQTKLDQRTYATLPDVKYDFETICNNAKRYNLRDTPVWLKAKELHSLIKITYVQIVESLPEQSVALAAPAAPADDAESTSGSAGADAGASASTVANAEAAPSRSKRILLRSSKSQQKLNEQVQPKAEPQDQTIPLVSSTSQPQSSAAKVEQQQPHPHPHPQQPQLPAGRPPLPKSLLPQQPDPPSTPARQTSQQPYTATGTPSSVADDDDDADGEDDGWDANDPDSSKLTKGGLLDGRKRPGKRGKRLKATLRQLVHDLRRVLGSRGYPIVQNFDALPDRSKFPDYYQVIQKPICLRDIEHHVYEKDYINAYALFIDLELMLNNAFTFYAPETLIWQDALEIRQYFEREAIPALIQDGFTLEKDDVRQSALPLHLAANSTIEAHKAAYKMIVSKTGGVDGASMSPEPSNRARLGSAGIAGSPVTFGSPSPAAPNHSAAPIMSTPGANSPAMGLATSMPMTPLPMSMPMAPPTGTPTSMSPMPHMPHGMPMSPGVGRPYPFSGTPGGPIPTASSARPSLTPDSTGRRPVGRPPGKSTPSRSNPYPFLERRVGPGRPKKHEAAARQAAIAAHEEMLRKQAFQQQAEGATQQQQAAALANTPVPQWQQQQLMQQQQIFVQQQQRQAEQAAQRQAHQQQRKQQQQAERQAAAQQQAFSEQQQRHLQQQLQQQQQQQQQHSQQRMMVPGTPTPIPFGAGMMPSVEPASPVRRKEAVLPAESKKEEIAIEGLEHRKPLISSFSIGMEVEKLDGQTLSVPRVKIKNVRVTQHTLQIPPNASSIMLEFALRMLKKKPKSKVEANEVKSEGAVDRAVSADGDVSITGDAPNSSNGDGGTAKQAQETAKRLKDGATNGQAERGKEASDSFTWPWQAHLSFNGKLLVPSWTSLDPLIDPVLLQDDQEEEFSTNISYSRCRIRLLPKRGINVFELTVRPDRGWHEVAAIPPEKYAIYFC